VVTGANERQAFLTSLSVVAGARTTCDGLILQIEKSRAVLQSPPVVGAHAAESADLLPRQVPFGEGFGGP
jgi:hypothetical protein